MSTVRRLALPPGLSEEGFSAALGRMVEAVGAEHVLTGPGLDNHADPYAFADPDAHRPAAAVLPASVQEIQAVLMVANDYRIPLWTVSRGRNYGYGDPRPVAGRGVTRKSGRVAR